MGVASVLYVVGSWFGPVSISVPTVMVSKLLSNLVTLTLTLTPTPTPNPNPSTNPNPDPNPDPNPNRATFRCRSAAGPGLG